MVEQQLRRRGIRDEATLRMMLTVPREQFVLPELAACAYDDRALAAGSGQTISQPYIVAYMTEQLQVAPDHRVLEIGTGTGYQTAILAGLAHEVFTVESIPELSRDARRRLERLKYQRVAYRIGDGSAGWSVHAPYQRIMVTAAAPAIPEPLLDQLAIGGKMILPIGERAEQRLTLVIKRADGHDRQPLIGCRFVRLIGEFAWND